MNTSGKPPAFLIMLVQQDGVDRWERRGTCETRAEAIQALRDVRLNNPRGSYRVFEATWTDVTRDVTTHELGRVVTAMPLAPEKLDRLRSRGALTPQRGTLFGGKPIKEPRDSQRSKVYKADHALDDLHPLPTVTDMERFVKRVWTMKRVQEAFPVATKPGRWKNDPPRVEDGRGRRRAGGSASGITMPVWSRRAGIVLHELAHTVIARTHGDRVAAHGWEFCDAYLKLVLYGLGREAHDKLKAAFKANRVRFTQPKKRAPLTPEAKAVLAERLTAARLARAAKAPDGTARP